MPPLITGLEQIADHYDGYLLDLFGTIHDGYAPLPGVLEGLAALKARGKTLLVISNAPRRNHAVVERMAAMGITDGHYDMVLSSGESAHRALRDGGDEWHAALGRACCHLGHPGDDSIYAGLDLDIVAALESADFILNTGLKDASETVADYADVLAAGAARGLPMLCANPDLVVLRGDAREVCAGALAARYATLGGEVVYHGKPHPPIYETAFALLGDVARERMIAIGDSLRTDVAGAAEAEIDSALVLGGIHADELGIDFGDSARPERLQALYAEIGIAPTYVIPALRW